MNYIDIENLEKKIKIMESELIALRNDVESKKVELRKLHDPCSTCGRSDKQGVITSPIVWVYPTVYPLYSNQYYCYTCNTWHYNGYICNNQVPWTVDGTSYTIPNNNLNISNTIFTALD